MNYTYKNEYEVHYTVEPVSPGRRTMSNGDPGYPDAGGELEITNVYDQDGRDVTDDLPQDLLDRMYDEACQQEQE